MKYIKDSKNIIIWILIVVVVCMNMLNQKKITELTTHHAEEIHVLDSTYRADSLSMLLKYITLDSSYQVSVHAVDSLTENTTTTSSTTKTLVRYIYKDSTIERYVENTEYVQVTEKTIKTLQDSIGSSDKKITELTNEITDLHTQLSTKDITTTKITDINSKISEPVEKKFTVYGNVFVRATQDLDVGVGAELGGEYKILSPLYIGAAIRKDGIESTDGYNVIIKTGAKLDF